MLSSSNNASNHTFLYQTIASISKDPERYQIIQETGIAAPASASATKRSGSKSYTLESKKRGQQSRAVGRISAAEMVDKVNREAMFMYMATR